MIPPIPETGPLALFINQCTVDLQGNRGSSFRGPRSFFYEAQETLRVADPQVARRREEIICQLIGHHEEIGEVILYEAADWPYFLPAAKENSPVYDFLDRCEIQSQKPKASKPAPQ